MPIVTTHPSPQELSDFGLGRLPDAAASIIASHLGECVDCRKAVENLPPDSFLGKFRTGEAETASLMADGTALPATASNLGNSSSFADVPIDIPPELANNPKFRILRVLGRGGMGVVYEAEHAMMGRHVALKVISPAVLSNPEALARFLGEVKAAGQLDHQNIARAYDADQADGLHFLVMEFVEGISLAQVLERKGPRPIAHACHYARQAALGLDHAFVKSGMVHRDIKPQNLMLTPKDLVKVLDFGLARLQSERKRGECLTQAGAFMGTPEYVSPEQATDARQADIRADIYSLGCTLYALLTGHPPFQEDTVMKTVLAQIEKAPRPVHEIRKDVPLELSAVVAKMLAKDPAQRHQKPIEVAQALEPFVTEGAISGKSGPADAETASANPGTVSPGETSRQTELGQALPKIPPVEAVSAPVVEGLTPRLDNIVESDVATCATKPNKSRAIVRPARGRPTGRKKWWIWPGAVAGTLVLGLLVLWAAGAFRVKTPNGVLIIENVPADAEVTVDGAKVTLSRNGQDVTVEAIKEGKHTVKIVTNGIEILSSELDVKFGADPVRVAVVPLPYERPPVSIAKDNAPLPNLELAADVVYLDSTLLMPLHPDRPKKVIDFAELHGADPTRAATWLKQLGPDYFPSILGEHATAYPPQVHAIAVRLDRPVQYGFHYARTVGEELAARRAPYRDGFRALNVAFFLKPPGPDGHFIQIYYKDTDFFWWLHPTPQTFDAEMADRRKNNYRPHIMAAIELEDTSKVLVGLVGAHERKNWDAARFLSLDDIKRFAESSRNQKRFVYQIRGYRGPSGEARFDVVAWDNPDGRDWEFRADMTAAEYEAELVRRKANGFRPAAVTSYGDPAKPNYTACWLRYFYRL